MISQCTIQIILSSIMRHGADAAVFVPGDRPRFYIDGESRPMSRPTADLTKDDIDFLAANLLPEWWLEQFQTSDVVYRFSLEQTHHFRVVGEHLADARRLLIWHCSSG